MGGEEEEDVVSPSAEGRFLGAVACWTGWTVKWLDGWMVGLWVRRGHHLRDHYCATSLSYCMDKYISNSQNCHVCLFAALAVIGILELGNISAFH